jgi:hypothetical protein
MHIGPPYLGAALICETVFEDAPGLTDVLHIHTQTLLAVPRGQTKARLAMEGGELYLWVRLDACDAPGDYEFDVRFLSPSGARLARQVAQSTLTADGLSRSSPHGNRRMPHADARNSACSGAATAYGTPRRGSTPSNSNAWRWRSVGTVTILNGAAPGAEGWMVFTARVARSARSEARL